jgi:hypothetical protein
MTMKLRTLLTAAGTALALTAGTAAYADWDRDHDRDFHRGHVIMKVRPGGHRFIEHTRVIEVLRGRHIRYIGEPYMYGGAYVVRCYDTFGRLAYCRVDPYSGAFLGINVRL